MIVKIKDCLRDSEDKIINILEKLDCNKIHKVKENEIRFGIDEDSSGSANSLMIDTLYYKSFSRGVSGDILTLTSELKGVTLGEAIKWLAKELEIKDEYNNIQQKLPFGSFWKQYSKVNDNDEDEPVTYPMSKIEKYEKAVSKMWIDDGISALTQEYFDIRFDHETNRISIPWFDECSELVGCMGRINKLELEDFEMKYYPLIAFAKSKVLYGFNVNYKHILEKNCVIIVESEKSVLKARDMGLNNVVALGGNNVSKRHERLIKSMYCDVIIALDEGLELNHCIEQANKLKIRNPFFSNNVFVLDSEGLPSKSCIFDLDKEVVKKSLEERLIYID